MEQLIEDYKRRINSIEELIGKLKTDCPNNPEYTRLKTKMSCYKTFISELERELKTQVA